MNIKKMNTEQRLELQVFYELESGFTDWMMSAKNTDSFYYFDRPKSDIKFWETAKNLKDRGYLTDSALNALRKYKEKIPTKTVSSPIGQPAIKEQENPISAEGKVYYKKLKRMQVEADTPWYKKINPLGAFIKDTWLGKLVVAIFTAWVVWTIKLTFSYNTLLFKYSDLVDKYKALAESIVGTMK